MVKRAKPIEPPPPEVKPKGRRRTAPPETAPPTFHELAKEHDRAVAEALSAKRVRHKEDPSVAGGARAGRPRSGRSGSDSNASRRSRGH